MRCVCGVTVWSCTVRHSCCTCLHCVAHFLVWLSQQSCFVKEQVERVVAMFHASLLPSLSVYGSWTTMKDVCAWAAVNDERWSLQNISLVAAVQPTDIKEAIEAAITGVVARTKLRLVYAAGSLVWTLWMLRRHCRQQSQCVLGRVVEEEEHLV